MGFYWGSLRGVAVLPRDAGLYGDHSLSCHCKSCSKHKTVSARRQLQPDQCTRLKKGMGDYPSKSKKVYMDRFLAARKALLRDIEWYKTAHDRGWEHNWLYSRLERNGWNVKKYREARKKAKELGLL